MFAGSFDRITPREWDTVGEALVDNAFRPQSFTEVDVQSNPRFRPLDAEEKPRRAVGTE